MNGTDLLSEFRRERSDRAFAELVRRFTNLVYSVARRRTGQDTQAQEVTQLVFIRLARTVPPLKDDSELIAWLHRTTVNASVDLWRAESRRRQREEQAAAMHTPIPDSDPAAWHALAPALDEALNQLPDSDRQALLHRYFQDESMREMGAALGISEDAAKMRVSRALDRLRDQLGRQGVSCAAGGLGALLSERAIESAPAGLADKLAAARYPIASAGIVAGLLTSLSGPTKLMLATGAITAVIVGGVTLRTMYSNQRPGTRTPATTPADVAASVVSTGALSMASGDGALNQATSESTDNAGGPDPDPLALLVRVLQARQQLGSSEIQYNLFTTTTKGNGVRETNYLRLSGVFDGEKRWVESTGREYSYVQVGRDASTQADPIIEKQKLDREGAVQAGLLSSFEARRVMISDGTNWMKYEETDGKASGTTVDDAKAARNGSYFFDFRCLGLSGFLHSETTLESCLGFRHAKSIRLLGRADVNGTPVWRVQVVNQNGATLDFWIDMARPQRVLKCSVGRELVVSQFDPASQGPLPSVVTCTTTYPDNHPRLSNSESRFTRVSVRPNVDVDPARWTLAGLGMELGTPVNDPRVHRRLGYWDGVGLSESLPPRPGRGRKGTQAPPAPSVDPRTLIATLEREPASEAGLAAAEWLLLNTPDGPVVEKAAEVVEEHHLGSTNLLRLAKELERFRHRSTNRLLEGMLERNPQTEIRATACFSLATLLKDACKSGKDRQTTLEAEKMLERVIREFGQSKPDGPNLAYQAQKHLNELRMSSVGKPAPETAGPDVEGQTVRLSDYRGRWVLMYFWSGSDYRGGTDNHRALQEFVAGRPLVILGVNCDHEIAKARERVRNLDLDGPMIMDGPSGPVATAWFIRSWPTVVVIDPGGVIRYRGSYSNELYQDLKSFLGE